MMEQTSRPSSAWQKEGRALVTGATGAVGFHTVRSLLRRGRKVRLLVRSEEKARALLPPAWFEDGEDEQGGGAVELAVGDVVDIESIKAALVGCSVVYHCAGLPEQWLPDPNTFWRVNVEGTRNMVDAAKAASSPAIQKFVFVSTIDVFRGPPGRPFKEEDEDYTTPRKTAYQQSKLAAHKLVKDEVEQHNFPAVFLCPAGVYGPGLSASPTANALFLDLVEGKLPFLLPGGLPLIYGPDVGEAMVLAAEAEEDGKKNGECYILSAEFVKLQDLARMVKEVYAELDPLAAQRMKVPSVMPLFVGRAVASGGELWSKLTGSKPLVQRGQVEFLAGACPGDSSKAEKELGWRSTPLRSGLLEVLRRYRLAKVQGPSAWILEDHQLDDAASPASSSASSPSSSSSSSSASASSAVVAEEEETKKEAEKEAEDQAGEGEKEEEKTEESGEKEESEEEGSQAHHQSGGGEEEAAK
ncbi:NAD-dependent epimerase/dehydratase family protein [Balamuthia mandrillaris]